MTTQLVGIVNLTPDSFSDGGQLCDPAKALETIRQWAAQGISIMDIGAESTRPGATPLSAEEEWKRLNPLLLKLGQEKKLSLTISVDTRHPRNAGKALALGAHWINDVGGFESLDMIEAVAKYSCKLVLMHSLSVPADPKKTIPEGKDVIEVLIEFAEERLAKMEKRGIARKNVMFDPGIGFGKTAAQSWEILRRWQELKKLGMPIFIGHSRKSFFNHILEKPARERDTLTLNVSTLLMEQGVDYLRVHDVAGHLAAQRILSVMGK